MCIYLDTDLFHTPIRTQPRLHTALLQITLDSTMLRQLCCLILIAKSSATPCTCNESNVNSWLTTSIPNVCSLRYKTNTSAISLQITVEQTNGWFAFALGSNMNDASQAIFAKLDSTAQRNSIVRHSMIGYQVVQDKAIQLSSLESKTAAISCTTTKCTLSFTRLFTSDDTNDVIETDKNSHFLCAFGNIDNGKLNKHQAQGMKTHNFFSNINNDNDNSGNSGTGSSTYSQNRFHTLHGMVMAFSWLICCPFAIAIVRYYRHSKHWLTAHRIIAQSTVIGASSGIFSLFTSKRDLLTIIQFPHAVLGFIMLFLVVLQSALGIITAIGLTRDGIVFCGKHIHFTSTRSMHRWLGRCLCVCGFIQCWTGAELLLGAKLSFAVKVYEILIVFTFIYCELCRYFFEVHLIKSHIDRIQEDLLKTCRKENLPTFTRKKFHNQCLDGAEFVIVAGVVIDIKSWLRVHPGGAAILQQSIGTDVTKQMIGEESRNGDRVVRVKGHSGSAIALLHEQVRGYLIDQDKNHTNIELATIPRPDNKKEFNIRLGRLIRKERLTIDTTAPVVLFVFEDGSKLEEDENEKKRDEDIRDENIMNGAYYKLFGVNSNNDDLIQRSYTPIKIIDPSNNIKRLVQFAIRLYPNGQMSNVLNQMSLNETIRISGPHYHSSLEKIVPLRKKKPFKRIGYIVGGTSIALLLQFINEFMRSSSDTVLYILWQCRSIEQSFAIQTFATYMNSDRLFVHYFFTNSTRSLQQLLRKNIDTDTNPCLCCCKKRHLPLTRSQDIPLQVMQTSTQYVMESSEESVKEDRQTNKLKQFEMISQSTSTTFGRRPTAIDIQNIFEPVFTSSNTENNLFIISGPPSFATELERILIEDLNVSRDIVCKLD